MKKNSSCRFCGSELRHTFVDLGMSPLCESYLTFDQLNQMEPFYPLRVRVCSECFLVQLEEYVSPEEIFTEYAYFSSYSDTWLEHARSYTQLMLKRFKVNKNCQVLEVASNDGYLLQYFAKNGIPVLGIEPAANVAKVATEKGIPTITEFFGKKLAHELASQGKKANLLIGNNVLAQIPDVNDFVSGLKTVLKPNGVITVEFPHLMRLMDENQFDTIYHEHFSYFSFITVEKIFTAHGLTIFDVDELPTHGGSLRIYARHTEDTSKAINRSVSDLKMREKDAGLESLQAYVDFSERVKETKRNLLSCLVDIKNRGRSIAGYGAPGKGNTLLNYCGIRTDFLDYTVDRNPYKHNKFTPGTHIPIYHPNTVRETKPDYLMILPWNLREEIVEQMAYIRDWGGKFIIPIPTPEIAD